MPSSRIPPLAFGISRLSTALGLQVPGEKLLADFLPVLHQILRQFFHRHAIDSGAAPVLTYPRQRRPDVAARNHRFHQAVASRALLSVRQRRRFATAPDPRGFTSTFQRQSQLLGLLAPGVFRTHSGFALPSVRPFISADIEASTVSR